MKQRSYMSFWALAIGVLATLGSTTPCHADTINPVFYVGYAGGIIDKIDAQKNITTFATVPGQIFTLAMGPGHTLYANGINLAPEPNGVIYKFDQSGQASIFYQDAGTGTIEADFGYAYLASETLDDWGLTVGSDGSVYSSAPGTVVRFTPDGHGALYMNYNLEAGLLFHNGLLYMGLGDEIVTTDTNQSYASARARTDAMKQYGGIDGLSSGGMATDGNGNFYISDYKGNAIYKGTYNASIDNFTFSVFADSTDGLAGPTGLQVVGDSLYVVDASISKHDILKFDMNGNASLYTEIPYLAQPYSLVVDPTSVPEPASLWLVAAGTAMLLRRKRANT